MMTSTDVWEVLDALEAVGVAPWVSGGWGVDALIGRQTRDHIDIDLSIPAEDETATLEAVNRLGYTVTQDWRPARILVTTPDGRGADIHPCLRRGDAWVLRETEGEEYVLRDADIVTGMIGGRVVRCITPAKQVEFHGGAGAKDHADMKALGDAGVLD